MIGAPPPGSPNARHAALIERLEALLGRAAVRTGEAERALLSQDVYRAGALPLAIVRPADEAALATTVRLAVAAGVALFPRGAGMSYTDAFQPTRPEAIVVDTTALDRIVEIDAADLHATVEAGCTWAQVDAALAPHGLRARFWGPMSGGSSTVGGAYSQGAATFGSARNGPSGPNALSFRIVLGDGSVLDTGAPSQPGHAPFFRHYGPDLTGLFAHDAGALGIKAAVTLALEPRPTHVGGVSFGFDDFAGLVAGVGAVARMGVAAEIFGMDAQLLAANIGGMGARESLAALLRIARTSGVAPAARVALAGPRFADRYPFTAHFTIEGHDAAQRDWARRAVRRLAGPHGRELANTVAVGLRAQPFPILPVTAMDGRRLYALHGIVPFSAAPALDRAIRADVAKVAERLAAARVAVMYVYAVVGANAFLYEPFFYWEDSLTDFHRARLPEGVPERPDNPEARDLVEQLRLAMIERMYEAGAAHLQIGRAYPWLRDRSAPFQALAEALKRAVDPQGLMNPGALGLPLSDKND